MSLTLIRTIGLGTAIVLGAAACGGDTDTTDASSNAIATLDDGTETTDSTGDETPTTDAPSDAEAPDDPELAFALWDECMADAGFDIGTSLAGEGDGDGLAVEDIELDAGDPQTDGFDSPEDFDESFQTASAECDKHLANVDSGFDLSPEQQAQFDDAQVEWAACMTEAGFDIPDFDSDGGAAISIEVGPEDGDPQSQGFGEGDFDFEAFEEAAEACNSAFDELEDVFGDESTEG